MLNRDNWMTIERVPVEDVAKEIDKCLRDSEYDCEVHIGSDAQKNGPHMDFATGVAIVRQGKGGRGFYTKTRVPMRDFNPTRKNVYGLQKKLFKEVELALDLAMEILEMVPEGTKFVFHVDVNPDEKWASARHLNELVGWVLGCGFVTVLTKPDAWLASHMCDHAVKNKNDKSGHRKRHRR